MSKELETLLGEIRGCTICKGLPLGPNPIFQLSPSVRILIVGQAPGRITHLKDRPFDDPSGDRLRTWLGVDRTTFYRDPRIGIFPMGLCYPGTGKGGDIPPRKECAETWRQSVLKHLSDVALQIVIGRYAIDWHAPTHRKLSVKEAVQTPVRSLTDTMILPHPSPRNIRWFRANPWYEAETIPRLQQKVQCLLTT